MLRRRLGAEPPDAALWKRIDALDGLTPGDVAAVVRRLEILGDRTAQALVRALLEDRVQSRPAVGFHKAGG
jgi:hypothetical protein